MTKQAQNIKNPMTSGEKFSGSEHRVFVMCDDGGAKVMGFIKMGPKHLYYYVSGPRPSPLPWPAPGLMPPIPLSRGPRGGFLG